MAPARTNVTIGLLPSTGSPPAEWRVSEGPVGYDGALEVMAARAAAIARGDAPEVVKSLADSVKAGGGRPELPSVPTGDPAKAKDALIGTLKTQT